MKTIPVLAFGLLLAGVTVSALIAAAVSVSPGHEPASPMPVSPGPQVIVVPSTPRPVHTTTTREPPLADKLIPIPAPASDPRPAIASKLPLLKPKPVASQLGSISQPTECDCADFSPPPLTCQEVKPAKLSFLKPKRAVVSVPLHQPTKLPFLHSKKSIASQPAREAPSLPTECGGCSWHPTECVCANFSPAPVISEAVKPAKLDFLKPKRPVFSPPPHQPSKLPFLRSKNPAVVSPLIHPAVVSPLHESVKVHVILRRDQNEMALIKPEVPAPQPAVSLDAPGAIVPSALPAVFSQPSPSRATLPLLKSTTVLSSLVPVTSPSAAALSRLSLMGDLSSPSRWCLFDPLALASIRRYLLSFLIDPGRRSGFLS